MTVNNGQLLQLKFIPQQDIDLIKPFFNNLPTNPYADGQFRLRRYSVIRKQQDKLVLQPTKAFVQDDSINEFQGNVERVYENLDPALLASEAMGAIVNEFIKMTGIEQDRDIEIHQFRLLALDSDTPAAPEGVHQDGFDHVCICGISHTNVSGGELLVYEEKHADPCFKMAMKDGMFALVNDRQVWHNATPLNRIDSDQPGYVDIFVFTA